MLDQVSSNLLELFQIHLDLYQYTEVFIRKLMTYMESRFMYLMCLSQPILRFYRVHSSSYIYIFRKELISSYLQNFVQRSM